MSRKKRLWLCLPPIALCLLDGLLTLAGQSAGYWSGDYQAANEFNPIFRPFLQWHPGAFIAGGAISMIAFTLAILYFPLLPAVVISFGFSLGHAIGAAGWLIRQGTWGYLAALALLVIAERFTHWAWRKAAR